MTHERRAADSDTAVIVPDRSALKTPLQMLKASKRPILLVGLGVLWSNASAELVALAERLGAPVLTTAKSKGVIRRIIPEYRLHARRRIGRKLVSQADLIVTVGLEAVELHAIPWPYSAPVLALSSVRTRGEIPAAAEVVGDLKGILDGLSKWGRRAANWANACPRIPPGSRRALDTPSTGLPPQRLFDVARIYFPGPPSPPLMPGRAIRSAPRNGWPMGRRSSRPPMGWLPWAMQYPPPLRRASPTRKAGGSFLRRWGFPDGSGRAADLGAREAAGSSSSSWLMASSVRCGSGRTSEGCSATVRNWAVRLGTLARGFGADGIVVETENALGYALSDAVSSGKTTLIAARVTPRDMSISSEQCGEKTATFLRPVASAISVGNPAPTSRAVLGGITLDGRLVGLLCPADGADRACDDHHRLRSFLN